MHKIPVGVLGASGYAGRELCALVSGHPRLALAFASANAQRGETARLGGHDVTFVAADDAPLGRAELVFLALPQGDSAPWVARVRGAGKRAIDLSADLRPGSAGRTAPYGLTEVNRGVLKGAEIIANPGCYSTAVLMALLPLVEQRLVLPGATITITAASGVTGAGMVPRTDLLFGEVAENFKAYAVGNEHHHLNEMRAVVAGAGADIDLLFTPHLLPVARGILATITVPLAKALTDPLAPYVQRWAGEPFVEISRTAPTLREVTHRNVVRISAHRAAHVRNPTLIVLSAIDNLMKGAAGQAVQNANLALGLSEPIGLPA